jgi:hypothetical protein
VPNFLKQLLTGKDGQTHDLARWSWLLSLFTVMGGAIWNSYHSSTMTMDIMMFAQAVAVIAGAHGVAIYAKKDTEPTGLDTNK